MASDLPHKHRLLPLLAERSSFSLISATPFFSFFSRSSSCFLIFQLFVFFKLFLQSWFLSTRLDFFPFFLYFQYFSLFWLFVQVVFSRFFLTFRLFFQLSKLVSANSIFEVSFFFSSLFMCEDHSTYLSQHLSSTVPPSSCAASPSLLRMNCRYHSVRE